MKVLYLTLKTKWYQRIDEGRKRHEFREVKPYWSNRLIGKHYDVIEFRLGYRSDSPRMRFEYLGYKIIKVKSVELYAIELGKRIS